MRRLFWAAMGVALISMVFAGCKKETTYTVQVTATKGGTVEGQNGEYNPPVEHVVRTGDNLWKIAKKYFHYCPIHRC